MCSLTLPVIAATEANPGLSMPEYSKKMGEMWKGMGEDGKKPYQVSPAVHYSTVSSVLLGTVLSGMLCHLRIHNLPITHSSTKLMPFKGLAASRLCRLCWVIIRPCN